MPTPNASQRTDGHVYVTVPYLGVMQTGTNVAYTTMTKDDARVLWESLGMLFQAPAKSPVVERELVRIQRDHLGTWHVFIAGRREDIELASTIGSMRAKLVVHNILRDRGWVAHDEWVEINDGGDALGGPTYGRWYTKPVQKPVAEPVYGTIVPGWNIIMRKNDGSETLHFNNLEQLTNYVHSLPSYRDPGGTSTMQLSGPRTAVITNVQGGRMEIERHGDTIEMRVRMVRDDASRFGDVWDKLELGLDDWHLVCNAVLRMLRP